MVILRIVFGICAGGADALFFKPLTILFADVIHGHPVCKFQEMKSSDIIIAVRFKNLHTSFCLQLGAYKLPVSVCTSCWISEHTVQGCLTAFVF